MKNGFKVMDIENHYSTPLMVKSFFEHYEGSGVDGSMYGVTCMAMPDDSASDHFKLGKDRLAVLDAAGIDFAQISLTTPGTEFFPVELGKRIATESNDILAQQVSEYPDRLGGWISLVPDDPEWSIREIERCAKMGLFGWMCLSNFNGNYLDDPKYWPILEKIEDAGMPIYIHPFFSQLPNYEFGYCMSGPSFGFMVDASTCVMRMIYRGVFDRLPQLKVVLGHDGEAFPFLKNRIDTAYRQQSDTPNPKVSQGPKHCPSYYLENNVWITTSGNYLPAALRCCVDVMAKGRIMMSTDFPYENAGEMVSLVAESDFLSNEQKQALLYDNARALGFGK